MIIERCEQSRRVPVQIAGSFDGSDALVGATRAILSYSALNGVKYAIYGTNKKLYISILFTHAVMNCTITQSRKMIQCQAEFNLGRGEALVLVIIISVLSLSWPARKKCD